MSLYATLTTDLRAAPSYLPPCCLCSHVGVLDFPDTIRGPDHYRTRRSETHSDGTRILVWRHSLSRCCTLSDNCPWFKTAADCASWWREKRLQTLPDIAQDHRRVSTLERLTAANLEAL